MSSKRLLLQKLAPEVSLVSGWGGEATGRQPFQHQSNRSSSRMSSKRLLLQKLATEVSLRAAGKDEIGLRRA